MMPNRACTGQVGFQIGVQVNSEVHLYTFPDLSNALLIGLLMFEPCLEPY
ncbi:hypothetical protein ANRL3_00475 [Anaerolineae bacterium]|nr:hypothetical protein ANRL3_00475 [Anaerolineae bacterium]